jgi:hypothetical protein
VKNSYRHGINKNVLFANGAKRIADEGGAYRLPEAMPFASAMKGASQDRR